MWVWVTCWAHLRRSFPRSFHLKDKCSLKANRIFIKIGIGFGCMAEAQRRYSIGRSNQRLSFRGGCKAYFFDPRHKRSGGRWGYCRNCPRCRVRHLCMRQSQCGGSCRDPAPAPHAPSGNGRGPQGGLRNRKREKEAFTICEKKIAEHKLEMKLVNVECGFEGNKIIFSSLPTAVWISVSWSRILPAFSV